MDGGNPRAERRQRRVIIVLLGRKDRRTMAAWFWLKAVPWSAILANAPALVDSARKLIERRNQASLNVGSADISDPTLLGQRLQALERRQQQTVELLESLARSNEQLTRAVAVLRTRALWGLVIVLALNVALAVLAVLLLR
jgi:hypothetical protein